MIEDQQLGLGELSYKGHLFSRGVESQIVIRSSRVRSDTPLVEEEITACALVSHGVRRTRISPTPR
jgi:hypothetical protein